MNSTDEYQKVPILVTGTRDYMDTVRLIVTVDLTKKEVVGIQPTHMIAWVPEIHAVIPPGAYWYHKLGSLGIMSFSVQPENATAYVAILTDDNFEKFKNNKAYTACVYDPNTSEWVNTTTPFEGKITRPMPFPGYRFWISNNDNGYLVVKNGDIKRDINVGGAA